MTQLPLQYRVTYENGGHDDLTLSEFFARVQRGDFDGDDNGVESVEFGDYTPRDESPTQDDTVKSDGAVPVTSADDADKVHGNGPDPATPGV